MKLFPIHKSLLMSYNKKLNIELIDGSILHFENVLEFSNSKYHLCLVLKEEDDKQCSSMNIPKDLIASAQRHVYSLDRYIPIKLNTRRMNKNKNKNKEN